MANMMANMMSTEELLEEYGKILKKMEIIENDMNAYLDAWDFVDVLNENNPPACYNGKEYGYGLDLKANHPEEFNEMFREWVKGAGPADISVYSNLKRKLYEIEAILDER